MLLCHSATTAALRRYRSDVMLKRRAAHWKPVGSCNCAWLVIADRIRQRVSSVVGRRAGEQKVLMRNLHDIEGIKFGSDQTMRLLPPTTMSPQTKPARTQRLSTRPRSAIPGSLNM